MVINILLLLYILSVRIVFMDLLSHWKLELNCSFAVRMTIKDFRMDEHKDWTIY